MKAKAFIDLNESNDKGEKIDRKKIRKHHSDIFRIGLTLGSGDYFTLPDGIKADLQQYLHSIEDDLPGKELFESINQRKLFYLRTKSLSGYFNIPMS